MKLKLDYSEKITEEHHVIFGTANRTLSEKFGLKVYLCPEHHRTGKDSAHLNADIAKYLQKEAQKSFIKTFKDEDFRTVFGKNFLSAEEIEECLHPVAAVSDLSGFKFIGENICG